MKTPTPDTTTTPRATGQVAHTPTPFSIHVAFDCRYTPAMQEIVIIGRGAGIAKILKSGYSGLDEANAAFIVTACNSHAALLEALERTAKHLQFLADNLIDDETAAHAACIEVCRQARAAIAKATEGRQ